MHETETEALKEGMANAMRGLIQAVDALNDLNLLIEELSVSSEEKKDG